jgi:hypothetical protein
MRNILRVAAVLVLALCISGVADAQNSVRGGTGKMRFGLGRYGTFWVSDASGMDQMDRASILVGLDSTHVFEYSNDAMYLLSPLSITTGGIADTMATALIDNSYPTVPVPPNIQVRMTVYAWRNDNFVFVKYSVRNISPSSYTVYIGMDVIPMPTETYGGESVAYDNTKKVAYYYRTGETPYVGVKLLGQSPFSFHVLDWDVYSPTSATADEATDPTLWKMISLPGFDAPLTAGSNGSAFSFNRGQYTIGAGDSTQFSMAYLYQTSLSALLVAADSADARYNRTFTDVRQVAGLVPEKVELSQNYPNPFNPSTQIAFALPQSSYARLVVYDALGRLVTTLVDQQLPAGLHTCTFDAAGLAGGVYFSRLTAGNSSAVRQMLLVK